MTSTAGTVANQTLGMPVDRSPFLAEQVAIDATNGLQAAEVGVRAFRSRPLLRRLWDLGTGDGAQRAAAVGSDLLVVQRATLSLVRVVMQEESRSQYCMSRVLQNLTGVNRDLDSLSVGQANAEAKIGELQRQLRTEVGRLTQEIEGVKRDVHREVILRRFGDLVRADELYPGAGRVMAAVLYLAGRHRHFAHETAQFQAHEWPAGLAVVKHLLPGRPVPTVEVLCEAVAGIRPEAVEAVAYLMSSADGPTAKALSLLLTWRLDGQTIGTAEAITAFEEARSSRAHADPPGHLVRYHEFAALAAGGLLQVSFGEDVWTLKPTP